MREGIAFAQARGMVPLVAYLRESSLSALYDDGDWDAVLDVTAQIVAQEQAVGARNVSLTAEVTAALVRCHRGAAEDVAALTDDLLPALRELEEPEAILPSLCMAAEIARAGGKLADADRFLRELCDDAQRIHTTELARLPCVWRACLELGDRELTAGLVDVIDPIAPRARCAQLGGRATLAELAGELDAAADLYAQAAAGWAKLGCVPDHGLALLGQGRCSADAGAALAQAREIADRLGAQRLHADVDAACAQAARGCAAPPS
jgi:hypothetical protein